MPEPFAAMYTVPTRAASTRAEIFAQRYAQWWTLREQHGASRSFSFAWRLPELARALGPCAMHRAVRALSLDLYALGRFAEALEAARGLQPAPPDDAEALELSNSGIREIGHALTQRPSHTVALPAWDLAHRAWQLDRPAEACAACADFPDTPLASAWVGLYRAWSGDAFDAAAGMRQQQRIARESPRAGAEALALLASARHRHGGAWALPWLDEALEGLERFGLQGYKVRLLGLKADALLARGELRDATRFQTLALELARRQGAPALSQWLCAAPSAAQQDK